ncbi:MAG: mechanosensitive ion channel family protein [Candidatus Eisenbacteria bacterium]
MNWSEIVNLEVLAKWLATSGLRTVLIILGAVLFVRLASFIIKRVERTFEDDDPDTMNEREKQAATLGKVLRYVVRVTVWGMALLMVLKEVGIDIGPILAGVGVAGLAIGFGAQSLVKDILAGVFVLIENQYHVGDVVRAADVSGLVEKITLRATTLRDLDGRVHVIPNGAIVVATNMTKQYSRYVLDVGVAYKEDVDEVMAVMKDVGDEMAAAPEYSAIITAPLDVLGVQDFGDSAVVIRVRFTTVPMQQWAVAREFRRRIKKAFNAKGIEIPFPHRTIYLGEGAPMDGIMRVRVDEGAGKSD